MAAAASGSTHDGGYPPNCHIPGICHRNGNKTNHNRFHLAPNVSEPTGLSGWEKILASWFPTGFDRLGLIKDGKRLCGEGELFHADILLFLCGDYLSIMLVNAVIKFQAHTDVLYATRPCSRLRPI